MKIELRSIHGNVVNDKKTRVSKDIKAHIEIGYSHSQRGNR